MHDSYRLHIYLNCSMPAVVKQKAMPIHEDSTTINMKSLFLLSFNIAAPTIEACDLHSISELCRSLSTGTFSSQKKP